MFAQPSGRPLLAIIQKGLVEMGECLDRFGIYHIDFQWLTARLQFYFISLFSFPFFFPSFPFFLMGRTAPVSAKLMVAPAGGWADCFSLLLTHCVLAFNRISFGTDFSQVISSIFLILLVLNSASFVCAHFFPVSSVSIHWFRTGLVLLYSLYLKQAKLLTYYV